MACIRAREWLSLSGMYTIIGGDGREYGPVSAEQVRQWIAAGRANLDTRAKAVGSDEWKRVAEFSEIVQPAGIEPTAYSPYGGAASGRQASRGLRLLAFLLDFTFSSLCWIPFLRIVDLEALRTALANSDLDAAYATPGLIHGVTVAAGLGLTLEVVQALLLTFTGMTLGKAICRVRIVRYPDAAPAGFVRAWVLRRFLIGIVYMIPYLGFLFFLIDVSFILGENRRTLHDRMAGTKVIPAA